jgi:hypothetical protein
MKIMTASCILMLATLTTSTARAQSCPTSHPVDCGSYCCPSGNSCRAGQCEAPCPSGYPLDCGSFCCPSGTTCGGSCGGRCCGTTSGSGGGSSSGDTTSGGDTQCIGQGTCSQIRSCCRGTNSGVSCWYEAAGKRFDCGGTCTTSDAERVSSYCSGSGSGSSSYDDDDDFGACSTSGTPGSSNGSFLALLIPALGALVASRRRTRGAASRRHS